jgi:hypothetical protein
VIEMPVDHAAMRRVAEQVGCRLIDEYVHRLPNGRRVPAVRYEVQREVPAPLLSILPPPAPMPSWTEDLGHPR